VVKKLSIALSAALWIASTVVPASAQVAPPQIVTNIGVRYGDLDLKSASDARIMLTRLERAATKACGGKPVPTSPGDQVGLAKRDEYRRCKAAAMERSTLRLGAPLVRAAWLEKRLPSSNRPQEAFGVTHADTRSLRP